MPRVNLSRLHTSRIRGTLDAVVAKRHGDLVLEGQDFGSGVSEVWGGDEYEYWVTVEAPDREVLMTLLMKERFRDAGAAVSWLTRHGFDVSGSAKGPIEEVRVGRRHRVTFRSAKGEAITRGSDFDRLTLALLQSLFRSGRFAHSSAFRAWLDEHGVPSRFLSFS